MNLVYKKSNIFLISIPRQKYIPANFRFNSQKSLLCINNDIINVQYTSVNKIAVITLNNNNFSIEEIPFVLKSQQKKAQLSIHSNSVIQIVDQKKQQKYDIPNLIIDNQEILPRPRDNFIIQCQEFASCDQLLDFLTTTQNQASIQLEKFALSTTAYELPETESNIGIEFYENVMQYKFSLPLISWIRGNKSSFLQFKEDFISEMGDFDDWQNTIAKLLKGSQRAQFLSLIPK